MNRHKSYFGPSFVLVAAAYLALFYWVKGFSFSHPEPLPEGVPVEWMELAEPAAGQPEPSSSPVETVSMEIPKELPPPAPPAAQAPPPQAEKSATKPEPVIAAAAVAAASVAPSATQEPTYEPEVIESVEETWTAPDSEIPVLTGDQDNLSQSAVEDFVSQTEQEPAEDSVNKEAAAQIATLKDSDFLEPSEAVEENPQEATAETAMAIASVHQSQTGPLSNVSATPQEPAFSNPFVDPSAPPLGRHGVLDARSLAPAAGNPPPSYPASDRLARREGVVVLLGYVTASGRLGRVTVEREASSAMTQESYRTFKSYRYRPGQTGWVRQTFKFTLRGAPEEIKATLRGSR